MIDFVVFDDFDSLDALARSFGLSFNDVVCGYLRQPIFYGVDSGVFGVKGTCSLCNVSCYRVIPKGVFFDVRECLEYRNRIMGGSK